MDSWDSQMSTPNMKFEHSPAESFLSTPGEMYPPLFGSSSAATTMNPLEIMTPQSYSEERNAASSSVPPETPTSASTSEKKQTKKRKSWGQVLPEPKTNLPPRKRAKTEDEKEQRRVERVLRNRRAAQSSRERKRLEVEALEERNKELEDLLRQVQQTNLVLVSELQKVQQGAGVVTRTSPSFNPVTFSQELFSSQDGHSTTMGQANRSIEDILLNAQSNNTVNPASLSPTLTPVADDDSDDDSENEDDDEEISGPATVTAPATTVKPSPDATQHPAAMLCVDLQCRSAEEAPRWVPAASPQPDQAHLAQALFLPFQLLLATTSVMLSIFQRPLMQIAMCLRAGSSLPPTPSILNTIIWLVTTPLPSPSQRQAATPTSTSSTSTTTSTTSLPLPASSSTTTRQQQRTQALPRPHSSTPTTSLRLKSLRKILSSSPTLARPLLDATMEALRLASSEGHRVDWVLAEVKEQRFVGKAHGTAAAAATTAAASGQRQEDGEDARATWPDGTPLPSRDVLLTLLWAITVEQRRTQKRQSNGAVTTQLKRPGGKVVPRKAIPTSNYVLKVVPGDRASSVA